jgi:hypothetical protein
MIHPTLYNYVFIAIELISERIALYYNISRRPWGRKKEIKFPWAAPSPQSSLWHSAFPPLTRPAPLAADVFITPTFFQNYVADFFEKISRGLTAKKTSLYSVERT